MADQSCAMGGSLPNVFGCEATNMDEGTPKETANRVLVTRTHCSSKELTLSGRAGVCCTQPLHFALSCRPIRYLK
jgi:hypothetical protein